LSSILFLFSLSSSRPRGCNCKQPRANNYHNMLMLMVSSTASLSSILFLFSLSSSRPRGCDCKQPRANNYHNMFMLMVSSTMSLSSILFLFSLSSSRPRATVMTRHQPRCHTSTCCWLLIFTCLPDPYSTALHLQSIDDNIATQLLLHPSNAVVGSKFKKIS
jgi:hypothetical protein